MKVSVIVPVYNVEAYLYSCLESLLNQSLENIEVIAVNDGSVDESGNILAKYRDSDKRLVVINQENKGLSAARNAGLERAQGEYVLFVDGDDFIEKDTCRILYEKARQQEPDILVFGRYLERKNGIVKDSAYWKAGQEYMPGLVYLEQALYKEKFTASACNKMYNRNFLQRHRLRFREGILYEDLYFLIQCLFYARRVVTVDCLFYHYIQYRSDSIINTVKERDKDVLKTICLLSDFFQKENRQYLPESTYYRILIYDWIVNAVAYKYIRMAPFSREAHRIVRSVIYSPEFLPYSTSLIRDKQAGWKRRLPALLQRNSYMAYCLFVWNFYFLRQSYHRLRGLV